MPSISDLNSRRFERILLIKPSALGDVVHTLPVLAKLRARYPEARIDWLITPENAGLVSQGRGAGKDPRGLPPGRSAW